MGEDKLKFEVMRTVISKRAKIVQKRKSAFLLELSALSRMGLFNVGFTSRRGYFFLGLYLDSSFSVFNIFLNFQKDYFNLSVINFDNRLTVFKSK